MMLYVAGAEKGTKYYAAHLIREKANVLNCIEN